MCSEERMPMKTRIFSNPFAHLLTALSALFFSAGPISVHAEVDYIRLKSFGYTDIGGALPTAALIEGRDGALYGTVIVGATNNSGAVFKVNKNGSGFKIL